MTQRILKQSAQDALKDTWAVFSPAPAPRNLARFLVLLTDVGRANAFLWTEAGLQVQEQTSRGIPGVRGVTRTLALGAVAADILAGYGALQERARWFPALVQPSDWEWQHERGAHRVLETAMALGGALIKACQVASSRPDLLPPAYIRTLATVQDRVSPRSWPEIERTIKQELGRPPRAVFAEIAREPIAAASIAQVHKARLPDGRLVAVKVQYPDIEQLIKTDLTVLEGIVHLAARFDSAIQLQPISDYLKETLPLELDFVREAEMRRRLRVALQDRKDVLVPEVIPELSTGRLLVMEYVEGIKITDRAALEQAGIAPAEVARLLNDVYADQMLHRGIVQADPHPGNLLVQPGPRLVLLDHGLTVLLDPPLVDALKRMVRALNSGDFEELIQALADAGMPLGENVDLDRLLGLVGVLLGEKETGAPGGPDSKLAAGVQLGKSLGTIPLDLLLVGRILGLLDGITKQLDPSINTLDIVAHYTQN